jgi:hypothetical protein
MTLSMWGKHISGPIFGVLSIGSAFAAAHFANNASASTALLKYAAYVTGGLSILLFFSAQYDVWKAERDQLDKEKEKNTRPDIKGSVTYLNFKGIRTEGTDVSGSHVSTEVDFGVYLVNRNDAPTNLQKIVLKGSNLEPRIEFEEVICANTNLVFGMGQRLERIRTTATIRGFSRVGEIPPIKLDRLEAYAVDGLRKWHWISVSDLKEVKFSD